MPQITIHIGGHERLEPAITKATPMGLLGTEAYLNFIITGAVLLLAASVDALARRRAAATGH